jgi:hypothetical protein
MNKWKEGEGGSQEFNFLTIFSWTVQDRIDETTVEEYNVEISRVPKIRRSKAKHG